MWPQVDGAVHGSEVGPLSRELGHCMCGNEEGGGQVMRENVPSSSIAVEEKEVNEVGVNQ